MSSSAIALGEPRAHDRERQILVEPAFADLAERHHLDQRQIHAAAMRPFDQPRKFVLVDALERDRVDLDLQAGGLRGVDAGEHLVQRPPARDGAEFLGIERVERDVDAPDAGRALSSSAYLASCEPLVVERQFVERAGAQMARQRGDERHDAAAHQRLAAGEAQFAHAARDEGRAQPVELLQREHIGLRQKGHVFRHAIDAAEIAAVGHRDAQIGDGAAERIDQRPAVPAAPSSSRAVAALAGTLSMPSMQIISELCRIKP